MPRIGDKAPEFKAVTTQGDINFPSDYNGSWTILFSHPSDFTPVCTSEFMTFATMEEKFEWKGGADLSRKKQILEDVFFSWIWQRFKHKTKKEIEIMLLIED